MGRFLVQEHAIEGSGRMKYEKPEVMDFGSISDHTFTTPGGQVKGGKPPSKPDEHGELSHEEVGS
jgi:hypothetical protein